MNITQVLDEIKKLSPTEKRQVADALRLESEKALPPQSDDEKRRELHRQLLAEGVIKNIPTRDAALYDFEPVPIKGEPLSETIIRERG